MIKKFRFDEAISNKSNEFTEALRDTGFAIITDFRSLSPGLITEFYKEWEWFFDQSELKAAYKFSKYTQAGYFPFGKEKAKGAEVADLKEFFHFYPNKIDDPLDGITNCVYNRLDALGQHLLAMAIVLPREVQDKLSEPLQHMTWASDQTLLRILNYPSLTMHEGLAGEAIRAAAHEDINLITLLIAGTETGLQVQDRAGTWHDVGTNPGEIVVNVGDMLQEATGGYLKSTTHRVINGEFNKARLSAPLFIHPRPEVRLSQRYTAEEYLNERLKELGLK